MTARYPHQPRESLRLPPPDSLLTMGSRAQSRSYDFPSAPIRPRDGRGSSPGTLEQIPPRSKGVAWHRQSHGGLGSADHIPHPTPYGRSYDGSTTPHRYVESSSSATSVLAETRGIKRSLGDAYESGHGCAPYSPSDSEPRSVSRNSAAPSDAYARFDHRRLPSYGGHTSAELSSPLHHRTESYQSARSIEDRAQPSPRMPPFERSSLALTGEMYRPRPADYPRHPPMSHSLSEAPPVGSAATPTDSARLSLPTQRLGPAADDDRHCYPVDARMPPIRGPKIALESRGPMPAPVSTPTLAQSLPVVPRHVEASRAPAADIRPMPASGADYSSHHVSAMDSRHLVDPRFAHAMAVPRLPLAGQHPQQRKRLRISRACDECRRRKTRCDVIGAFPGEPGHPSTIAGLVPPIEPNQEPKGDMMILQPCMNCRRSGIGCSYSKRPLKRGPSKGYIKDLERRLNSLESQMVAPDGGAPEESTAKTAAGTAKPRVRTEDRIIRLEQKINTSDKAAAAGHLSSSNADVPAAAVRIKDVDELEVQSQHASSPSTLITVSEEGPNVDQPPSTVMSKDQTAAPERQNVDVPATTPPAPADGTSRPQVRRPNRSTGSAPAPTQAKDAILQTMLHASFPVVSYTSRADASIGLEAKILSRGFRILSTAIDPPSSSPSASPAVGAAALSHPSGAGGKTKPHSVRVAQIIGQASAGLDTANGDLFSSTTTGRVDRERLKTMRKLAAQLAAHEADLLMLCQLDQFRRGQSNKSALAAAVTKLDSGASVDDGQSQLRRRIVMSMMDRWHSVGFGTPHVLTGRHALERLSLASMKSALADAERAPLSMGTYEVLRASIMMGHLHDMAQSLGGWKRVSQSDLESIVHSVSEESEPPIPEGSRLDPTSDAALRYSLENALRVYHALHTLPPAGQAKLQDIGRIFDLTEKVICLGKVKTPLTPASKLFLSAIGPPVISIVAVSFAWCYKVLAILIADIYASSINDGTEGKTGSAMTPPPSSSSSSSSAAAARERDGLASASLQPLEHYRRKMSDYVRMVGMLSMFSGGSPDDAASFKPLYLRISLFQNQTLGFCTKLGCLLQPPAADSPARDSLRSLEEEADSLADTANEMGCLGYILASTSRDEAWSLLSAPAPTPASETAQASS